MIFVLKKAKLIFKRRIDVVLFVYHEEIYLFGRGLIFGNDDIIFLLNKMGNSKNKKPKMMIGLLWRSCHFFVSTSLIKEFYPNNHTVFLKAALVGTHIIKSEHFELAKTEIVQTDTVFGIRIMVGQGEEMVPQNQIGF